MSERLRYRQPPRDDQFDGNRPYYDKGGHRARGRHWKDQRLIERKHNGQIHRELDMITRREMRRDPRSGRK